MNYVEPLYPVIAAIGLGVPISATMDLEPAGFVFFCIGLWALFSYFGK